MLTIVNAFSVNMLDVAENCTVKTLFQRITRAEAACRAADGIISAVGHEDTAKVFSVELGVEVPANRATVTITPESGPIQVSVNKYVAVTITPESGPILLGQYKGPRLPEGATTLPEGAEIQWFLVDVVESYHVETLLY
jgi:hypothetical protein